MGMTGLFAAWLGFALVVVPLIGWRIIQARKMRRQDEEDRLTFRDWPL